MEEGGRILFYLPLKYLNFFFYHKLISLCNENVRIFYLSGQHITYSLYV